MSSSRRRGAAGAVAAAALVVFGLCAWIGDVRAAVINVPADHATIQAAINAAAPGDTIRVAAGTYNEDPNVTVSDLLLEGADKTTTIIRVTTASGMQVNAGGLTMTGFTVRQNSAPVVQKCLYIGVSAWASNVTVRDCVFDGTGSTKSGSMGIQVRQANAVTIDEIESFGWTGYGVNVYNSGTPAADDVLITDSYFHDNGWFGVSVDRSTNVRVRGNTITGPGNNGMAFFESATMPVTGSDAIGNEIQGPFVYSGILVVGDGVVIRENEVHDVSDPGTHGIRITTAYWPYITADDNTVENNFIYDNEVGILVDFGTNPEPTGNVIRDNSLTGNTVAVRANESTVPVDASGNWLGVATPSGAAAAVEGFVDYTPWLAVGDDIGDPGFHGDYSVLWVDDDSPQSGTAGRIQEGIDVVTGSTVHVAAGPYADPIVFGSAFAKNGLLISGDASDPPVVTGGVHFQNTGTIDGIVFENLYLGGTVPGQNRIFKNGNSGAINGFSVDNCVLDGENVTGRMGIAGNLFGESFSITGCEIKNILGFAVMDMDASSDYSPWGGNGLALDEVVFSDNIVRDCNGTISLRGHYTSKTVNVEVHDNLFENIGGNEGEAGQQWAAIEVNHAEALSFLRNRIDDVACGEYSEGQAVQLWDIDDVDMLNNSFTNCCQGLYVFGGGAADPYGGPYAIPGGSIHYNNISGNTEYGMKVQDTATGDSLDAEMNWWGDATGPNPAKRGLGDDVVGEIDFDPWIGKSGGENIVVVNDPEYLTAASPVKTVSVDYLGGGSGLVYGYSVKFSWDGAVVSTATNKVTEGNLLSDLGATRFFKNVSGTNEITVDCVLLGDQPGVTGPGTMFSIEFTGLAVGTSPVDVTVISVRDKYNNDLYGFYEDDGELIVDVSNPSVTNVLIENTTLAHTDDYIKDTDAARVTATVTDDDPAFGIGNIKADLTGLGGGPSVSPDSCIGTVATWNVASAACSPPNDTVTVTVTATDPIGNVASAADDIIADNTPPGAITGFDASPHHERVSMAWANPSGLDTYYYGVLVRYDGGGDYPEYATLGAYPADPAGGDGDAYDQIGVTTGGDHNIAARDIYYYTAFAYDWALNHGPAATSAEDRATNYWLGDVDASSGPGGGDYDGDVDFDDISVLSAAYWMAPPTPPHNECDVGRTDTGSPFGIPVPDDLVNFEDLMVFALNFNVVTPAMKSSVALAGDAEAGPPVLRLLEGEAPAEGEIGLRLVLGGNESTVKGASVVLRYDPERAEYAGLVPSAALASGGVLTFARESAPGTVEFDWAVLGAGRTVQGTGDLALVRFVVKGEDAGVFGLENARVRDVENGTLAVAAEGLEMGPAAGVPQTTRLAGAWPNPFNPSTVVRFDLSRSEHVTVRVYDPQGRVVRTLVNEVRAAGHYELVWDGTDGAGRSAASGAYFVRMEAGSYRSTTKITLVR
ncbi:MAG: right-handed parallel beta-helix repeat-containing protein [Candidatus Eisenbacteria bacterium]